MSTDDGTTSMPPMPSIDEPSIERYFTAQLAFDSLITRDFPSFSVEDYVVEKAATEGIDHEKLASKLWSEARSIPNWLDLTGDGKLGLDDAEVAAKRVSERFGKALRRVAGIGKNDIANATSTAGHAAAKAGRRIVGYDYGGAIGRAARKVEDKAPGNDADTFQTGRHTAAKIAKTAVGLQGLQDRKKAAEIKQICDEYVAAAEQLTEHRRIQLNVHIEEFGALRLEALHETLGRFLRVMEALKQRNRVKEYELLAGLGIDTQSLDSMETLDMTVGESLRTTAATGALGIAAVLGTPALVTSAVGSLATASTGTAISSLSGAAANSAILAWLGGGSIAAGGGGMAAGTVVMAGITAGATAGVTILAAGILISTHYAKKLTEVSTHEKEVALAVASLEQAWLVMDGITRRVEELSTVTDELRERLMPLLTELENLVPVFDPSRVGHAKVFNQCGLLVKAMVELAQVPLLGDDGELTDQSLSITVHVKKVLNTEV